MATKDEAAKMGEELMSDNCCSNGGEATMMFHPDPSHPAQSLYNFAPDISVGVPRCRDDGHRLAIFVAICQYLFGSAFVLFKTCHELNHQEFYNDKREFIASLAK